MGMRIVWEVRSNDIPRIVAGMEEAAIAVVTATLFDIEASAKGKVAVDTGNLRNSITTYPQGLTGEAAELVAGQHTLTNLLTFPAILVVAFGALWFYMRGRKQEA